MVRKSIPPIPPLPAGIDPKVVPLLRALRDASEVRFGTGKNQLDRSPTVRELADAGMLDLDSVGGIRGGDLIGRLTTLEKVAGEYSGVMPDISGVTFVVSQLGIVIKWNPLVSYDSSAVLFTEIWRTEALDLVDGGYPAVGIGEGGDSGGETILTFVDPPNAIDESGALMVPPAIALSGVSIGNLYGDYVEAGKSYLYFLRYVGAGGQVSAWHDLSGSRVDASIDVQQLLDELEDQITLTQLDSALNDMIGLIPEYGGQIQDISDSLIMRTADLQQGLLDEALARNEEIQKEREDRTRRITDVFDLLQARISSNQSLVESRTLLVDARVDTLTVAVNDGDSALAAQIQTIIAASGSWFVQPAEPTVDIGWTGTTHWIDTDDENKHYVSTDDMRAAGNAGDNYGGWADITDTRIAANFAYIQQVDEAYKAADNAQASSITAISSQINNPATGLTAISNATSALDTYVKDQGAGGFLAQATRFTDLSLDVTQNTTDILGNESAINAQVTALAGLDTFVRNNGEDGLLATSSRYTDLVTRVDTAETDISGNDTAISQEVTARQALETYLADEGVDGYIQKSLFSTALGTAFADNISGEFVTQTAFDGLASYIDDTGPGGLLATNSKFTTLESTVQSVQSLTSSMGIAITGNTTATAALETYINDAGVDGFLANSIQFTDLETNYSSVSTLASSHTTQIAGIFADVTGIEGDITSINGTITGINGDITDINGDIADQNGMILGLNAGVTAAWQSIIANTNATSELETYVNDQGIEGFLAGATRFTDLETSYSSLSTTVDGNTTDIAGFVTDVAGVTSDLAGLEGDVSSINGALLGIGTDITGINTQITGIGTDITGINTNITGLGTDVAGINTSITGIDSDITGINSSIAGFTVDISGINTGIDEIIADILQLEGINTGQWIAMHANTTATSELETYINDQGVDGFLANAIRFTDLETNYSALDIVVTGHTTDIANNTAAFASVWTAVNATTTATDELETYINDMGVDGFLASATRFTALETNYSSVTLLVDGHTSDLAGLTIDIADNAGDIAANTTAIAGVVTSINANASAISTLDTYVKDQTGTGLLLNSSLFTDLGVRLDTAETDIDGNFSAISAESTARQLLEAYIADTTANGYIQKTLFSTQLGQDLTDNIAGNFLTQTAIDNLMLYLEDETASGYIASVSRFTQLENSYANTATNVIPAILNGLGLTNADVAVNQTAIDDLELYINDQGIGGFLATASKFTTLENNYTVVASDVAGAVTDAAAASGAAAAASGEAATAASAAAAASGEAATATSTAATAASDAATAASDAATAASDAATAASAAALAQAAADANALLISANTAASGSLTSYINDQGAAGLLATSTRFTDLAASVTNNTNNLNAEVTARQTLDTFVNDQGPTGFLAGASLFTTLSASYSDLSNDVTANAVTANAEAQAALDAANDAVTAADARANAEAIIAAQLAADALVDATAADLVIAQTAAAEAQAVADAAQAVADANALTAANATGDALIEANANAAASQTAADAAQTSANSAQSIAITAANTASSAIGSAANAHSAADQAIADAVVAQAAADAAQIAADAAQAAADLAATAAATASSDLQAYVTNFDGPGGLLATATSYTGLTSRMGTTEGNVTALTSSVSTIESTTVSDVVRLEAIVGGTGTDPTTSLIYTAGATLTNSVVDDKIEKRYFNLIDESGRIIGYEYYDTGSSTTTPVSAFNIYTDVFTITNPTTGDVPFSMNGSALSMDLDAIDFGTSKILAADIQTLTAGQLTGFDATFITSTLGTAWITDAMIGNVIQSNSYNYSTGTGWKLDKTGSAVFGDITVLDDNGDIVMSSGNAAAAYLSGIAVFDSSGNTLITSDGTVGDTFTAAVTWDFDVRHGLLGWAVTGGTFAFNGPTGRQTSTATDTYIWSPIIYDEATPPVQVNTFSGWDCQFVQVKVKRAIAGGGSADWQGTMYYSTSGHGISANYNKIIDYPVELDTVNQWVVLEWNMFALTNNNGGEIYDWIFNNINNIRLDLDNHASSVFDIDWIRVGRRGGAGEPGQYNSDTLEKLMARSTIDGETYIRNLSVKTLQLDGNSVTLPNFAVSNTTSRNIPTTGNGLIAIELNDVVIPETAGGAGSVATIINWSLHVQSETSGPGTMQIHLLGREQEATAWSIYVAADVLTKYPAIGTLYNTQNIYSDSELFYGDPGKTYEFAVLVTINGTTKKCYRASLYTLSAMK